MKVIIDGVEYIPAPKIEDVGNAHIDALNLKVETDIGTITIREYLHALLAKLWKEEWAFNSKRPFGNSGWQYPLRKPLIAAGFVSGELIDEGDGDYYVNSISESEFNEFTKKMIYAVFFGKPAE